MKTSLLSFLLLICVGAFAQAPTKIINGNITSNRFFSNDTIYILDGFVFVKNNATLTIEKGTVVKGIKATRSTLIVTMGSKIIADGTKAEPIVFTSNEAPGERAPGDWGGIVILGRNVINRPIDCTTCPGVAVANSLPGSQAAIEGDIDNAEGDGLFGGTLTDDNSGILRYVRIEFAGVVITPGNEINSLTLGGVGRGTVIEHIHVSYGNDDSFEWFGGNVDGKYLISNGAIDDDFDVDFGFQGRIQFAIAQRDSFNYDTGTGPTTNGFESDGDNVTNYLFPRTNCPFSNVTIIGPQPTNSPLSLSGNSFNNGVFIRRGSNLSLFNSVVVGFPIGLNLNTPSCINAFLNDTLFVKNNLFSGFSSNTVTSNVAGTLAPVRAKFFASANDTTATSSNIFVDAFNYDNPNFNPASGSPALSGASFNGNIINDPYFTPTTYKGAVGPNNNWTECWTNFNPQNTVYDGPTKNSPNVNFTTAVNGSTINCNNLTTNGSSYLWTINGAGQQSSLNVSFDVTTSGAYTIQLISSNNCGSDTLTQLVDVVLNIANINDNGTVVLAPNPAQEIVALSFDLLKSSNISVSVLNIEGKEVMNVNLGNVAPGKNQQFLNVESLSNGLYIVNIRNNGSITPLRLIIAK